MSYEFTKISDEYTILRTMFMNDGTEWYSFKDMNLVYLSVISKFTIDRYELIWIEINEYTQQILIYFNMKQ